MFGALPCAIAVSFQMFATSTYILKCIPYLLPCTKINPKWTKHLNLKPQFILGINFSF